MAKQIDKIRKMRYKQNRLKGKPISKSLKKAGYSKATAEHKQSTLSVVKVVEEEIRREMQQSDITIELVLSNLNEDRELARKKNDIATMKEVDALLGKFLTMFSEHQRIDLITHSPSETEELRTLRKRLYSPIPDEKGNLDEKNKQINSPTTN